VALAKVSVATRAAVRGASEADLTPPRRPPTVVYAPNAGGSPPRRTGSPSPPDHGSHRGLEGMGCGWCGKPPGLTPRNQPRNVKRVAPRQVERLRSVRARSLRTQQRAESQCQQTPSAGEWAGRPTVPSTPWRIPLVYDEHTACRDQRSLRRHTGPSWTARAAIQSIHGEFDPGSGRTLAACLTHASRARPLLREGVLAANG
jgi:hypothetical protein